MDPAANAQPDQTATGIAQELAARTLHGLVEQGDLVWAAERGAYGRRRRWRRRAGNWKTAFRLLAQVELTRPSVQLHIVQHRGIAAEVRGNLVLPKLPRLGVSWREPQIVLQRPPNGFLMQLTSPV